MATLVEQLLGPVFAAPAEAELAAEVHLRVGATGGWEGLVTISDAAGRVLGRRELRTNEQDCGALERPLLLVIALAIDPELGAERLPVQLLAEFNDGRDPAQDLLEQLGGGPGPPRDTAGPGDTGSSAAINGGSAPASEARHASTRRPPPGPSEAAGWQLRLQGGAVLSPGALPGWAAGVELGVEAEPPQFWPLRLAGSFWPGSDAEGHSAVSAPLGVRFAMAQLSLSTCPLRVAGPSWALQVCAGVLVAQRWTASSALDRADGVSRTSFGPLLRTAVGYDWSRRFASVLALELHAPLTRDIFTYTETDGQAYPLFRPAALAVSAYLGIEVRI